MNEQHPELQQAVQELTTVIKERTSLGYRLLSGLITGVATAIGATVIAGGVIFLVGNMLKHINLSSFPFLEDLVIEARLLDATETETD